MIATTMRKKLLAAVVLSVACVAQSSAADVKMGGVLFAQYSMIGSDKDVNGNAAKGWNSFDVSRVYMTADVKVDEHWKGRALLEGQTNIAGGGADTGGNAVFVKQAFIEYANLMDSGVNVQFGQIPTIWTGYAEAIWGRRYIRKVATDEAGVLNTADKGVSVWAALPAGLGNVQAMMVNGEGVKTTEAQPGTSGRGKDYALRIGLTPFAAVEMLKNVQLHGYIHQGRIPYTTTLADKNRARNRVVGAVSYKDEMWHAMYEYWYAHTGSDTATEVSKSKGYSMHGSINLGKLVPMAEGVSLVARHDRYDLGAFSGGVVGGADSTVTDYLPRTLTIVGVEKTFNPNVRFAFDVTNEKRQTGAANPASTHGRTTTSNRDVRYNVHAELKF